MTMHHRNDHIREVSKFDTIAIVRILESRGRARTMQTPSNAGRGDRLAWIGRAHVRPRPGNEMLGSVTGAIVNALALASNRHEYIERVTARLESYDLNVVEIEDVEPCEALWEREIVHPEIQALARSLTEQSPVALHTFHAYQAD
jgi:hypothetical protein